MSGRYSLLCGNALDVLASLDSGSVQVCVTSPPFFGLRDYGTGRWEGGSTECDHMGTPMVSQRSGLRNDGRAHAGPYDGEKRVTSGMPYKGTCGKCGAVRIDQQIGLEATPAEYIANLVQVFREVRRVLRDDATLWIDIADSYRDKQLLGIPWRLAFALQDDGWVLRADLLWCKLNPLPSSVTDRPSLAHEYLFLLAKRPTYYYDHVAVMEPALKGAAGSTFTQGKTGINGMGRMSVAARVEDGSRNLRSWLALSSEPYADAHFAVMPTKLVEPCLLSGSAPRACEHCHAPWRRVVERTPMQVRSGPKAGGYGSRTTDELSGTMVAPASVTTTGWVPTCRCTQEGTGRCTVLDPFSGSATVGVVALRHDRHYVGIDLNPEYIEMSHRRLAGVASQPHLFSIADLAEVQG